IDASVALFFRPLVEFFHRQAHIVDRNVDLGGADDGLFVGARARHPIHVSELAHRRPSFIAAPPRAARREPDRKRFGEVFVGMLLRIPAFDMTDVMPAEWYGTI